MDEMDERSSEEGKVGWGPGGELEDCEMEEC